MQKITKLNTANNAKPKEGNDTPDDIDFAVIFGTMFLFIITAFVYISSGILLIARGGILILLMIVSPFLFIGMVLPVFRNTSSKLWSTLFKRAFLAPIFMAILYISMSVAGAFVAQQSPNGSFANALGGSDIVQEGGVAFGSYILIIMLLLSSLTIAQKLGAEGASAMIGAGQRMRKSAQKNLVSRPSRYVGRSFKNVGAGVAGGAAAAAGGTGRRTLGRLAYNYTQGDRGKAAAASGLMGRAKMAAAKKVSEASFDVRSDKKNAFGQSQKGGYAAYAEQKEKQEKKFAKSLERSAYDANGNKKADFEKALENDEKYAKASVAVTNAAAEKAAADQLLEATKQEADTLVAMNTEIKELREAIESMPAGEMRSGLEAQVNEKEAAIRNTHQTQNQSVYDGASAAKTKLTKAEKLQKAEASRVEGDYTYAHVDALKAQRNKERDRWQNLAKRGAAKGAVVGALAGPAGAAIGALVGGAVQAAAKAAAQASETQVAAITADYGADGRKKVKNKKTDDLLKGLKSELEKVDGGADTDATKASDDSNTSDN